ncbi:MAG: NUDIX domain-containing protein [Thermaerobacter sp.]|nr:NUDIX domain-containing protein [Thermaerobacter sp.]
MTKTTDYEALQEGARQDAIQRTVVGIAVRRDSRLLVLQRKSDDFQRNLWEIPGGHVEVGESIPQAVARELQEETGWTLQEIMGFIDAFDYDGEAGDVTREWNFHVTAAMTSALVHTEHQAHAWVGAEDYGNYPMTDEMRRTVARALDQLG